MRKCAGAAEIHMLVEKELSTADAENLNGHMRTCERCSGQFQRFSRMKSLIEASLAANSGYYDSSATITRRAFEGESVRASRSALRLFIKRALVGAAACLAAIALAGYLFAHFYFQRTFSYDLRQTVLRTTDGIEMSVDGAQWRPLRVGDRLKGATLLRMPANAESFMSFDGVRLLSDGKALIEPTGERAFSLREGELVVASARKKDRLTVELGEAILQSSEGVVRIARSEETTSVGVASGVADITLADGTTHRLIPGQTATLGADATSFDLTLDDVENPFARLKESVMDRVRRRFAAVMSEYNPKYKLTRQMLTRPEKAYRFASYNPGDSDEYIQTNDAGLGGYYDTLFTPSNRSISIGRQRLVPVGHNVMPSYPAWSHDGSMIAYAEDDLDHTTSRDIDREKPAVIKVARLDDLENPWVITQEEHEVLPFFQVSWAPDNRHVLFMVANYFGKHSEKEGWSWYYGPYKIMIAPIDPTEGPVREFESPFTDIQLSFKLAAPIGKTISPHILKLPWGDALLCVNWGNIAYIPIEQDGQSVRNAPGTFLTDFSQYEAFVTFAIWSPSGSKITFMAVEDRNVHHLNVYILYDVEDILDGFAPPPRSLDDPRIKKIAPTRNDQLPGGFSYDESMVFFQEDVNGRWNALMPMWYGFTDFDLFYASALPGENGAPTQIHLPDSQVALTPSPEGNRIAYCNYQTIFERRRYHESGRDYPHLMGYNNELRVVSFDIEADIDVDLGGVLIDNSGTSLIVPPGTLEENFGVRISTPFSIGEEAELGEGETTFFAMRLIDSQGLEKPRFIEPMTLTIRYTDDEVEGLDEGMLEIYYYDETDPENPVWVPLGGAVDPDYNEITVEIRHFSKFSVGGERLESAAHP